MRTTAWKTASQITEECSREAPFQQFYVLSEQRTSNTARMHSFRVSKKNTSGDFPGGPVTKTLCCQCRPILVFSQAGALKDNKEELRWYICWLLKLWVLKVTFLAIIISDCRG